jgi:hypothetical protein
MIEVGNYKLQEYIIGERIDAGEVLKRLEDTAIQYDTVSVMDYYDLLAVQSNFLDSAYGWTERDIKGVNIIPVRNGYILNLPDPRPLANKHIETHTVNKRKYKLMEKYLKGDITVNDLIDMVVELEERL